MQNRTKTLVLAVAACLALNPVSAQFTDTTGKPVPATDTVHRAINWSTPVPNNAFPLKSFIIPAALISYGVTSLGYHSLKDLNNNIKEEIAIEHPHHSIRVDDYLQYAPALAVYGLNAAGIKGKHNFKDRTLLYGMSMLISNSAVFSIKKFSGEMRPDESDFNSFPSGHTANAFVAAEFMRQEYKDVSPWYGVAGYAVAATTGYLRMYNNKHWFSDVVAGAGVGIASTRLAYWLYPMLKRGLSKNKNLNTVVMPTYQDGAVGLGLIHKF
ncbi:phosphatase PAP2 family protein [Paraflavitalea sp. CAU 1676]|uniref:phosphatase PAP2 family protein n=1 Tax=Paraflavitalea sp. CAU 1676 TaxID=3032598 RepID=UPI0023DA7554|nr:phosphatase PAP2 family protein [Paraflavitalea sp. CAU 1676]MDF2188635.1 phosphatase PAP2 family protein [Paraflavitalea sp. CAU 1676]